jgi:hypothetical protein
MKIKHLALLSILTTSTAFGSSIKDFDFYKYEVAFTNPQCSAYEYDETVYSFDGNILNSKPKNVFCQYGDKSPNQKRKASPHYKIRGLVTNPEVKELFLTYLSFSNSDIATAVCEGIEKYNTKVTFIIDKNNEPDAKRRAKLDKVANCKPSKKFIDAGIANYPKVAFRGNEDKLGYAHNKIIMAKYKKHNKKITIVFSSGNMSSGTVLHHENWHFLTTSTDSYFAQAHECIKTGMLNHALPKNGKKAINIFKTYIKSCRANITAKEESDIKLYIVPSDGPKAMKNIVKNIKKSVSVDVAAHRFTHHSLINAMSQAAKSGKDVRFVADDDIFWTGKVNERNGRVNCKIKDKVQIGANMCNEYFNVKKVEKAGVKVKYMQTNHNSHLLHHNKYVIFEYANGDGAVHCGAGNFTGAAFGTSRYSTNFENFYFIKIPEVVEAFKKQYKYKFSKLATSEGDLPSKMQMPNNK